MSKSEIQKFLNISIHYGKVNYEILETINEPEFNRLLIKYKGSENDEISAYLFLPQNRKTIGSVLVHYQHNGERHWGKSEWLVS